MWFTKDDDGFRGWLPVYRGATLQTGLASSITVTVVSPDDTASDTPGISESVQLPGLYTFLVPSSFFATNGLGQYSVVAVINAASIRDVAGEVLRVFQEDFDTLSQIDPTGIWNVPIDPTGEFAEGTAGYTLATVGAGSAPTAEQVADAVWEEDINTHVGGTPTKAANVLISATGQLSTEDLVKNVRVAILEHVVAGNPLGLTLEESLNLVRQILDNKLELADGGTGDANWKLYADNDIDVLRTWDVSDLTGADISQTAGVPSRRTRGTPGP